MLAAAAAGPTAYWYLTRGTGVVALILLTVSVALGVANIRRVRTERVPRFVIDAVHRNVSLLAIAFLLVHIITSLLDGFAPIRVIDTVFPFISTYRPLWLGLGAIAFDLLVAVAITSMLRRRFGYRAWRATHWAAYAAWPVALLHGLGTGSDVRSGWMLVVIGGSVIVMIVAVVSRVTSGWPDHAGGRLTALIASALVPLGLLVWLPSGPLAAGWARKAGTPASLLRVAATTAASSSSSNSAAASSSAVRAAVRAFTARASGTISQGQLGNGLASVDISLSLAGQRLSTLKIHLEGEPLDGGGIQMTASSVALGSRSTPSQYRGTVTSLSGTDIAAQVSDGNGNRLTVNARLALNPDAGSATGTVGVSP